MARITGAQELHAGAPRRRPPPAPRPRRGPAPAPAGPARSSASRTPPPRETLRRPRPTTVTHTQIVRRRPTARPLRAGSRDGGRGVPASSTGHWLMALNQPTRQSIAGPFSDRRDTLRCCAEAHTCASRPPPPPQGNQSSTPSRGGGGRR